MKQIPEDTFTKTVRELCDEVDYLKHKLEIAEEEAEHWRNEHAKLVTDSIQSSQRLMGNFLVAALEGAIKPQSR